jgi:nucleoid-associated protein YgaU
MPNDAKLGLVVGVMLVIAVAVVFFRRDGAARPAVRAEVTQPAGAAEKPLPPQNQLPSSLAPEARQHIVQPGDTLFSLAKQYYGDGDEFYRIWKANRSLLENPDQLPRGLTLRIP